MTDLRQDFLDGMSFVAATVNVVATDGPAGRVGTTVSAMSSVSADTEKPTLLICVNDNSAGAAHIIENGVFTVNILRDDQSFVSDTFAGRYGDKGEAKFACAKWDKGSTGAPVLSGALASFDCRLIRDQLVGQHHVFFGEVQQVHLADKGKALIYANRAYSAAFRLPPARGQQSSDGYLTLSIACLSSFAPFHLPRLLMKIRDLHPGLEVDVLEGDQAQVAYMVETGEAMIGLMYDRDLPDALEGEALREQSPYALFAAEDPRAGSDTVSLHDLVDDPLVLLDQPLSREYVNGLFAAIGRDPNIAMRTASFELVRSLVGNGLGYSLLVTKPAGNISYDGKRLEIRPLKGRHDPVALALVRRQNGKLSEKAEDFSDICRAYFTGQQC